MRRLRWMGRALLAGWAGLVIAGCGENGGLTDTVDTVKARDISGVAGPSDSSALQPAARLSREVFGTGNTEQALAYPNLNDEEREVFTRALRFFITSRTPENGLGPVFNQNRCLGCHMNAEDIPRTSGLLTSSTPVSRAGRQGVTNHGAITKDNPPPTAAFTLFGDFFPAGGVFDPLTAFGGPIQHVRTTGDCLPDVIPPESIDPNLQGGIDPVSGLSALGGRRALGERAAPPYIGRGLMEAIHAGDIVANEDPGDKEDTFSSLAPPPGPDCPGDCISGRHNENRADLAFIGGDPVVRVSRFGLRAAGPTLFQFMIGGTQGEIGLTSPFAPVEQNNNQNVGRNCDIAPDPELKAQEILDVRTLIRLISLPDFEPGLLESPPRTQEARDIQAGAVLFGVDLDAFRSRVIPGLRPVGTSADANLGIAADRKLNCVACHIPIMRTGQSPAAIGGRHLSNRYVPLWSDLLLHHMTQMRQGKANPVPPAGTSREINRNLADFAMPAQGLAFGTEWRTPPLMGIGRVGPPFMHDGRVFLNPAAPGETVYSDASGASNAPLIVDTVDKALQAAIELHDLPPPVAGCPQPGPLPNDTCPSEVDTSAQSLFRSEAKNVIQKWHRLTREQQMQVIRFLKSL